MDLIIRKSNSLSDIVARR